MKLSGDATSPLVAAVTLVAKYCGVSLTAESTADAAPTLHTPQGPLVGAVAACTFLAEGSKVAAQLLGSDDATKAQIADWISRSNTDLLTAGQPVCAEVNTALLARTFLVGTGLTLADLMVFAVLQPTCHKLAPAELVYLCNLTRWADYVYMVAGAAGLYKQLAYRRPGFAPPAELFAAPAATAPKGKADAAKGEKGEKGGDRKAEKKADGKEGAAAAAAPPAVASAAAGGSKEAGKEGKKEKKEKKEKPPPPVEELKVSILDIRVGTIVECAHHPNADALYVEKIDVGEVAPRQVVSGLVKFVPLDRMQGARVLVLCNLKPAKMRDVESSGMVLCTSNDDHTAVDLVRPPAGVPNGERITWAGVDGEPPEGVLNPKKKQFEKLAPGLKSDEKGVACFEGNPFLTTKGPCTTTMPGCQIK